MKTFAVLTIVCLTATGCATTGLKLGLNGGKSSDPAQGGTNAALMAAMGGGLIGGSLGKGLDDRERRMGLEAEYRALEYAQSGQTISWKSSKGGRSGDVVPAQPYRVGSQDCRQYSHTVRIDGSSQSARGTACRDKDGGWTTLS